MSLSADFLRVDGAILPNNANPANQTVDLSLEIGAATGIFAPLKSSQPASWIFNPIAFSSVRMASLWSVRLPLGWSFDAVSMLVKPPVISSDASRDPFLLVQGNGVTHIPGAPDQFCVFSIRATWIAPIGGGLIFSTAHGHASFGAYGEFGLLPPTNVRVEGA
jgi:hypothetical protein